jgi:2-phosphosulfolactate phosphatase
MMQIQTNLAANQFDELALREKTAVVIDVLRASTTVITALANGARKVIPTPSVEAAAKIAGPLVDGITIRGGERGGKMIEGFTLGNSPLEYTDERVREKSVVYSTTNGSPLFLKAKYARHMLVCSFVNISTVAGFLKENSTEIEVLCAGNSGRFALEDGVCAGMLVHLLADGDADDLSMCDATLAARALYRTHSKSLMKMLKQCEGGKVLTGLGYEADLQYAAGIDTVPVLPVLDDNILRLRKDTDRHEGTSVTASA